MKEETFDIAIIGAGSGGLVVAAVAAGLGYKVALCEKNKMGGECLNTGCVPSKALLAAGKAAFHAHTAARFGVQVPRLAVDALAVHEHIQHVIAAIAPHDSKERFEKLGVTVIKGAARFTDSATLQVETGKGTRIVKARRYVVASGSSPAVPPIDGLEEVPYLTNESIFELKTLPEHLVIVGGGPVGVEMAQAYRRLGSAVTVIEAAPRLLSKDDESFAKVVLKQLEKEEISLLAGTKVVRVSKAGAKHIVVETEKGSKKQQITASHLLIAAGRVPNTAGLGLEEAGIKFDRKGIVTGKNGRTSNRRCGRALRVYPYCRSSGGGGYRAHVVRQCFRAV